MKYHPTSFWWRNCGMQPLAELRTQIHHWIQESHTCWDSELSLPLWFALGFRLEATQAECKYSEKSTQLTSTLVLRHATFSWNHNHMIWVTWLFYIPALSFFFSLFIYVKATRYCNMDICIATFFFTHRLDIFFRLVLNALLTRDIHKTSSWISLV